MISLLKSIYRHWIIQIPVRGVRIIYIAYIHPVLFRKKYLALSKFKDIHKGKRCFIVATGPSLRLEDVEKLNGEYTFAMNSIYKLFDKTDWRPTYYAIIDSSVFSRIKHELLNLDISCAFFPDFSIKWDKNYAHAIPVKANFCLNRKERSIIPIRWRQKKMGNDMTKLFYEGTSVVHFIMQIAFYMGFSEIYLLGTDCNFSGKEKHSSLVSYKDSNKIDNFPEEIHEGLIKDYQNAKEVSINKGVKIYNATRGGMLEIFERVKLEDVL